MKKIKCTFLWILVLLCTFFSFSPNTLAAADNSKFDVKIDIGYNDNYKIGFSTPINITVKNKFKDINGEIEIRVPSTPGKYMSYVKPISLQKDAEKSITINIPVSMNRTKYTLNIYNGRDKVYEDSITTMALNNITNFIGIFSDDFDSLSYINEVPAVSGGSTISKVIKLDEKNFPEDIFTFNAFDIIVINDYDTSKLNKTQYDILKQWVTNGGTLLLGTGSKYNKTLSVFKDDFITGTQGSVQPVTTSLIYELATNGDNKNQTQLDALSLSVKDSSVLMKEKDTVLVQSIEKGKGVVGILAFDMGQAPFVNWNNNTAFMSKLIGVVNPEIGSGRNVNEYRTNDIYMVRNAMNQFSEMARANTSSFYLILLIYVLAVAPLSYFILKKFDKRELMWITVPVIAVVFSAVVFYSASGTRLGEITTNMISFLNIDDKGNASADTYAGIFNSNKMNIRIEGKNGERLVPVSADNYRTTDKPEDNQVMEAKIITAPSSAVEYKNSSLLETKILQLQETSLNTGRIETNLTIKEGRVAGEIKNSTRLDLVDCLVIMPDGYYRIESLKSGESAKLDGKMYKSFNGSVHQMISEVFFAYNSRTQNMGDSERKLRMDRNLEGSVLQQMYNNVGGVTEGVNFIAFSKTQIHNSLIVNGKEAKKNERNIVYFPIELNFISGDNIDYPYGFVPFSILNTTTLNYDNFGKMFYGEGTAEIEYKLDKNLNAEEIGILNTNNSIPSLSIYNLEKNAYEPLLKQKIKEDDLKIYVSKDNTVKLKLEVQNKECAVPQMAAKGRKK